MRPRPQIRVFLSSTFRDMRAEREALVKRAFPRLREHCLERGAELSVIDLRWGITREQSEKNQVVELCLDMVDSCRPFFVGLLGQRYGWIPEELSARVVARHPWLRDRQGMSLTEMEIRHGALNHGRDHVQSLFYLRDDVFLDGVKSSRASYVDGDAQSAAKLAALRDEITASPHPVKSYLHPDELASVIIDDLAGAIEGSLLAAPPAREVRRTVHREIINDEEATRQTQQKLFMYWRKRNAVQDGRLSKLFVDEEERLAPLVDAWDRKVRGIALCGAKGAGKSHTLAELRRAVMARDPDASIVSCHEIEMGSQVLPFATWSISEAEGLDYWRGLEATEDDLKRALERACQRKRVLIAFDAVTEEASERVRALVAALPAGVTLAMTAAAGDTFGPEWSVHVPPPPSTSEVEAFCVEYFAGHGKALSDEQLAELTRPGRFEDFGALAVAANELRLFGSFEQLDEVIASLATAPTTAHLFKLVLRRTADDLGAQREQELRLLLSALVVGGGLTDAQAATLLGMPFFDWQDLRVACSGLLVDNEPYRVILRDEVATVLRDELESDEASRTKAHAALAELHAEDVGRRLHHLAGAGDEDAVATIVSDISNVDRLYGQVDDGWVVLDEETRSGVLSAWAGVLRRAVASGDRTLSVTAYHLLEFLTRQGLASEEPAESRLTTTGESDSMADGATWVTMLATALRQPEAVVELLGAFRASKERGDALWRWLLAASLWRTGQSDEARELALGVLQASNEEQSELLPDASMLLAKIAFGRGEGSVTVSDALEEALSKPRWPIDDIRRIEVRRLVGWIHCDGDRAVEGERHFESLRESLREGGGARDQSLAAIGHAHALRLLGERARALAAGREGVGLCLEHDLAAHLIDVAPFYGGMVYELASDDPADIDLLEHLLARPELASHVTARWTVAHALGFALWRGKRDLEKAGRLFADFQEELDPKKNAMEHATAIAGEAYVRESQGQLERALELLEEVASSFAALGRPMWSSWMVTRMRRAGLISQLGRHGEALDASDGIMSELAAAGDEGKSLFGSAARGHVENLRRAGREEEAARLEGIIEGTRKA